MKFVNICYFFFFFQAEDGIRDKLVTGVQTWCSSDLMINYTEKIWGIPCRTIHPDWAKQRIKGLNLLSVAKNALWPKKGKDAPKSLVDEFFYPQFGTGRIYQRIAERLGED